MPVHGPGLYDALRRPTPEPAEGCAWPGHGFAVAGRCGADVAVERDALASAYSPASSRVAFLLHGLSENETFWSRGRDRVGTTYADTLGRLVGDLLVLPDSAQGRSGSHELFPRADVLHVPGADHFNLLNHARVNQALRSRLA